MGAKQSKFFNPDLHLSKEEEAERKKLVRKLDKALATGLRSKKEEVECWALLNPLYSKPGCKGKWKKFVTSKGHKVSTVNGLIKRLKDGWQESARKPKPRLNQPNSGRFTEPDLAFTDKPFPDGKEILEAAFLFTADEKEQFMEALRIIGPEEALGIMFQAVVEHVERMREGVTTRIPLENPIDSSERMMTLADDEGL
jgi:hypothetical protein